MSRSRLRTAGTSPLAAPPSDLEQKLRRWYRKHRRPLPWRSTRDPYRIWVSEVMLQQTQVATAIPFYQRFLERFPALATLARARLDEVLTLWSGLGYYQRARRLHEASRVLMREHAGRIPDDPEVFSSLPGVGRYTAGAVMSMAFDRPLAVLDGNVARVLSRLFVMHDSIRDPRGARRLWRRAEALVPRRSTGEWNQALMELGAVICTARTPRCADCPVATHCTARARGRVAALPPVPVRRATEFVRRAIVVAHRAGRLLVSRRSGALLNGLWEPPGCEVVSGRDTRAALGRELAQLGVAARLEATGVTLRHRITHRDLAVEVWRGSLGGRLPRRVDVRLVDPLAPEVGLTALAQRAARWVETDHASRPNGRSAARRRRSQAS